MDAIRRALKVLLAHRWVTGASAAAIAAALVVGFATWGAGAEGSDATPSDEAASPSPTASHRAWTPRPQPTAHPSLHPSSTPAPSPSAMPAPSPTPAPSAAPNPYRSPAPGTDHEAWGDGGQLPDVNGRWCPSSPANWNESCYVIDLPEVRLVGDGDPSHVSYVYPVVPSVDVDPRGFTDENYLVDPSLGGCWEAAVDGYPGMSGAAFIYCPASAAAADAWIDDPLHFDYQEGDTTIYDYTGHDRLYMTQWMTPFPYIRSDA